tara:strand:+ start:346 stop:906 length:561 start_codon:yes stop_codon:yes gene_type:complete
VTIKKISDYSYKNINKFKTILPNTVEYNIFAPAYHPYYIYPPPSNIPSKDIDILFFGVMNDRRNKMKEELVKRFPEKNILFSFEYGKTMEYSFRSKIVLVIHYYIECNPIDFYRINKLICNKIFIIHEQIQDEEKSIELKNHLVLSEYSDIPAKCEYYLNNPEEMEQKTTFLEKIFREKYDMNKIM